MWSGDIYQKKLVTVAWHNVCKPIKEGGLAIRNLVGINEAGNLKLCWDISHSDFQWATFLRSRVMRNNQPISYNISSSIWCSAKHKFPSILNNSTWQLGNGETINFWCNSWFGEAFVSAFNIPTHTHNYLQSSVSHYIINNKWNVPTPITNVYPTLQQKLRLITIPIIPKEDKEFGNILMMEYCPSKMRICFITLILLKILVGPRLFGIKRSPLLNLSLCGEFFTKRCPRMSNLSREDARFPQCAIFVLGLPNPHSISFLTVNLLRRFGIGLALYSTSTLMFLLQGKL